jgi:hypothetical protein
MDVDHIPAGADFVRHIEAQLANCSVLLAVIGRHWLNACDESGSRRLDDPDDLVLTEISMALRLRISVIPVLVDGASMPKPESLPVALKPLARRNAVELRNTQFGADADRLIGKIREAIEEGATGTRRWRVAFAVTIAMVLLAWAMSAFVPIADWRRSLPGNISAVEDCDRTLGPTVPKIDFSGVFAGIVMDNQQSGADVQLKLVRNGNAVQGSYLRAEICGSITGEVTGNRLTFSWRWAGSSGRGIAAQTADGLSGTSGLRDEVEGGGTFLLFQKQPN